MPKRNRRQAWLGLAVGALLLGPGPWSAARAQQATDDELKALIPDAAVHDPQAWARATPPRPVATATPALGPGATPGVASSGETPPPALTGSDLRPDSPMAELPAMALPWPDGAFAIPQMASLPADPDLPQELATAKESLPRPAPGDKRHRDPRDTTLKSDRLTIAYQITANGFPEREELEARFRALSAIETLSGKDKDSAGQVAVRARSDQELLQRLLRIYGYYENEVIQTVSGIEPGAPTAPGAVQAAIRVRFDVSPGPRYRFGTIELGRLDATGPDYPGLRKSLGIEAGDPLHMDAIVSGREHLDTALGEAGYPFAKISDPGLVVDDRGQLGDLTMPVAPGGKYRFGAITSSLPRYMPSRHLARIARFKPGQVWKRSEVDDLRRAILATGLVSSVTVTPREVIAPAPAGQGAAAGAKPVTEPGTVALDVAMTKAPQRTIAGAIGYDTGEGFRLEASWEHRNLFPPEGLLRFRAVAGTDEQLAGVTFRRNNYRGRDRVLTFDLYADNANLTAYAARKVAFAATYERLTTLLFQKPWAWSLGFEAEASQEREGVPNGITTGRTGYITVALPVRGAIDHSNDLLDPTRGWRTSLRISPEVARSHGAYAKYVRAQFDASAYQPVSDRVVLAARVRLGAMPGTSIDNIAPSRRFYAGGGGSIRGFGYELVGPVNALGEPKGGRSLYEFSLEARIKTGLFSDAFSVVPFLDMGGADLDALPHFRDIRKGAGIGLRYATGFGPIRVDLGTPLDRRTGESRVGVYVALGQAF